MAWSNGLKPEDFYLSLARGEIQGQSGVIVRGHNPSQSSASGFVDVSEFGDLTYLTTAETMNIVSTSTDDDSAGIGLRTLLIQGVANSGAAVQEVVIMDGTSNVLTTNSYLRVNNLVGLTAGSSGWNVGSITATASTAATIQDEMDATESISQSSHYTVPLGLSGNVVGVELNAAKIGGGGSPVIEFKGYARLGGAGAAWIQLFDKRMDTGVTDEIDVDVKIPGGFTPRTDIRFRTDTDTNSTESRTRMYLAFKES